MDNFVNKNPMQFAAYKIIYEHDLQQHPASEGWHVLQVIKESRGNYLQEQRQENNAYNTYTVYTGNTDTIKLLMGRTVNGAQIYG
jgi:hypothetical protein